VSCWCEELVAEATEGSGTQRKGSVCRWKPLPSNGSEDVTVDIGVCVYVCVCTKVNCKMQSRAVSKESNKSGHQSKTRL
jgi:hypothetical protein